MGAIILQMPHTILLLVRVYTCTFTVLFVIQTTYYATDLYRGITLTASADSSEEKINHVILGIKVFVC